MARLGRRQPNRPQGTVRPSAVMLARPAAAPTTIDGTADLTGAGALSAAGVLVHNNTAEGGTNGVAATTGNTGGASGDAFDVVSLGTSGAVTFDNTWAAHGSLSYKVVPTAAGGSGIYVGKSITASAAVAIRFYVFIDALPSTATSFLRTVVTEAGNVSTGNTTISSNGSFSIQNPAGTLDFGSPAGVLVAGNAYRFEYLWTVGAGTGTVRLVLYAGDSLTPITDSGLLTGRANGSSNMGAFRLGKTSNSGTWSQFHVDDIAWVEGSAELIGPAPTTVATIDGAAALTGAGSLTAAGTVTQLGTATLTGAGSVTADVTQGTSAAPTGAGTLTAQATQRSSAALTAAGTLSAVSTVIVPGTATLAGAGTLTVSAGGTQSGTATLTGAGSLTAQVTQPASATLTGAGTLSAQVTQRGSAALTGAGTLTAQVTQRATAALAGAGTLTAGAGGFTNGAVIATGAGTLSAAGMVIASGTATLIGAGTVSAQPTQRVTAGLAGAGTLAAAPRVIVLGAAALTGAGTVTAGGTAPLPFTVGVLTGSSAPTASLVAASAAASLSASSAAAGPN